MKVPFRSQVSEFDCVPTAFVNAIVYLFERDEIPPSVLQRIYLYTLDTITSKPLGGHGTSEFAVKLLANYLCEVKTKSFRLHAEFYEGANVHLGTGNPIAKCLNGRGVALMRVKDTGNDWHYILGLHLNDGWVECYDSYQRRVRKSSGQFEIIESSGTHGPNLRVHRTRLDTKSNRKPYCFGTASERECVLLTRPPPVGQ